MWLGAHIRTSDGLPEAAAKGREIGCEAIQIFSKSPQTWKGPPIAEENARNFRAAVEREGLKATSIHHAYLTNLASPKPALQKSSRTAFLDELHRADLLGADHVIFHPGAHMGTSTEAGIARIVAALDWATEHAPDGRATILLENAAGQGTTIGSTFEELAAVLGAVREKHRVAVAVDTCHLFASGVDFRTPEGYGAIKDRIAATVGLGKVRAFHLNDSKAECGSHLDRHENIGKGAIGTAGFVPLLNDPTWAKVPGYLETPLTEQDYAAYIADLAVLRGLLNPAR